MEVAELRLKERTALLVGPLTRAHQSLAHKLTHMGADVVLATPQVDQAQRFANQLLEAREAQEKYGRAATVPYQASSMTGAKDMVSRAAEYFGGVDILVESLILPPRALFADESLDDLDELIQKGMTSTLYTTRAVLPFLRGRKRGRVIYLLDDLTIQGFPGTSLASALRSGLIGFSRTLARELGDQNITINCISQGLTEDFLLAAFPKAGSAQASLQELRQRIPGIAITDAERIADTVTYLASSMGTGITGQLLTVRNATGGFE